MHDSSALTVDLDALTAWLQTPSPVDGVTRAEAWGVNDDWRPHQPGSLSIMDNVQAGQPDGLLRRADIRNVTVWPIPDGEASVMGALITVDLTNGIRLATQHQDLSDFTDRDYSGVAALVIALQTLAYQVSDLVVRYESSLPVTPA